MKLRSEMKRWLAVVAVGMAVLVAACGGGQATDPGGTQGTGTPEGQVLLDTRCTPCHSLSRVTNLRLSESQWRLVVTQMVQMGARLNSSEENIVVTYLAQNYGN
jgi:hypothetical protein